MTGKLSCHCNRKKNKIECSGLILMKKNAIQQIIEKLNLERHPLEGGFFRRTYESEIEISTRQKDRKLLSSIYYLLCIDEPFSYLHKNESDIIHYYHLGGAIEYLTISPEGCVEKNILGSNIEDGEQLQLVVKAGYWKASRLVSGEYGLISEAVSPGFDYADNQLATIDLMTSLFPDLRHYWINYIANI